MKMSFDWARCSPIPALMTVSVAFVLAHVQPARPEEQQTTTPEEVIKNCLQEDTAWLAIRACTAMLNGPESDISARSQYYRSRGLAWLKDEEPKEALADFTRALELGATDLRSLAGRARANAALGDHNAAASDWTRAIEQTSSTPPDQPGEFDMMYLGRGTAWLAAGNTDAALTDYAKALELNPNNTEAHIARANAYLKLNDRDRALGEFELASKIDPSDIRPYMARGEAAERLGDTQLAIESYLTAAKTNPRGAGHARQALKRLGVDKLP